MGASSSGLLDEAKTSHIKGLVDNTVQSFSQFYRQQYTSAYVGHLHQEVEPKKEGRGLLLSRRSQSAPEEVLYQGSVKFSCWDEHGKKCRERYAVLRRDNRVEIHDNKEIFTRGCDAKLVIQPAGGIVLTTEEESRAHLEQICAGILNGVKEDSSSVVATPDVFAVYLHLPYTGHTCFLFQKEEERDHFLAALKTCIRHCNLDPWCEPSYESQAYIRALCLYRQDKGCYESWEKLLGTKEQVLASQVMDEVLPWLQSQLQSKLKGKKAERIRQWLATVGATYTLVLDLLTTSLKTLREECHQTASANQVLIRSNLDQIMSSHCFLEEKITGCIREEAEKVYVDCVGPYMSSILEVLTENIGAGIQGMRHTLHTKMDSALTYTHGGTAEMTAAFVALRSISLDQSYKQVENLTETLADLKQRFKLSSTRKLVHSAHLEMEWLLDSAVYTLELFLQSSARLQPSQLPVKMDRAKERVLKQLDYDSRIVQRRLCQEALLEITLPALTRRMDSKKKTELQQFEQYIFSDYSNFILVRNVYDDVLRKLLSKEIETVVQDAASKKSTNALLDISDLAISQYSLLGQTPPHSEPVSPSRHRLESLSTLPGEAEESAPVVKDEVQTVTVHNDPELEAENKSDPSTAQSSDQREVHLSPIIVVTQQFDEPEPEESGSEETFEDVQLAANTSLISYSSETESSSSATPNSEAFATPDSFTDLESSHPNPDPPESMSAQPSPPSTNVPDVQSSDESSPLSTDVQPSNVSSPPSTDVTDVQPSNVSSPPSTDVTDVQPSNVSSPPSTDVTDVQPSNMSSPPSTDVTDVQPSNVSSPPSTDVTDVQPSNVSSPPSTDVTDVQPSNVSSPPSTDVTDVQPSNVFSPPSTDVTDVQPSNMSSPPSTDVTDVQPSNMSSPPSTDVTDVQPSNVSSPPSTDVPVENAQSDDPAAPEISAPSDHISEEALSVQPPLCKDGLLKISLESLNKVIGSSSTEPSVLQATAQQSTDRAVYLTGEIKDSWEAERRKEEKQNEAEKKNDNKVDDEENSHELKDEEREDENGDHTEKEEKERAEEKVGEQCNSAQPVESLPVNSAELAMDSVAIIRDLVTEIIEVETSIGPCTTDSNTP